MFPVVSGLGSPAETNVPPIWGSLVAAIHRHKKKTRYIHHLLVGGFNHLEKYWSMGKIIPYIMENKKCSKPPTS